MRRKPSLPKPSKLDLELVQITAIAKRLVREYRLIHELAYGQGRGTDVHVAAGVADPTAEQIANRERLIEDGYEASAAIGRALNQLRTADEHLARGRRRAEGRPPLPEAIGPRTVTRRELEESEARAKGRGEQW